ncbi:hypothetical protein MPER_15217, partial [Moniliophthora perniciosa FA553]
NARRERGGRGVWRYVWDQDGPTRSVPHHAADLVYLFDNLPAMKKEVEDEMFPEHFLFDDDDDDANMTEIAATTDSGEGGSVRSLVKRRRSSSRSRGDEDGERFDASMVDLNTLDHHMEDLRSDSGVGVGDGWMSPVVDSYSYTRVRDAIQERWIAFANGETPWNEDKVWVFGPEGETGERSGWIFDGRRRRGLWREVLEPLGM